MICRRRSESYPKGNYRRLFYQRETVTSIIFNPATRRGAARLALPGFNSAECPGWRRNACFTRASHSSAVYRRQVRAGFVSKAIGLPRDLPRPRRAPPPTIHDRTNYRSAEKDHRRLVRGYVPPYGSTPTRAIPSRESQINGGHNFGR